MNAIVSQSVLRNQLKRIALNSTIIFPIDNDFKQNNAVDNRRRYHNDCLVNSPISTLLKGTSFSANYVQQRLKGYNKRSKKGKQRDDDDDDDEVRRIVFQR